MRHMSGLVTPFIGVVLFTFAGCARTDPFDTSEPNPSTDGDGGLPVTASTSPSTNCSALAIPTSVTPPDSTPVPSMCACTRRPGLGNSYLCPMGADESVTASLGPNGGSIELMGQQGKASGVSFRLDFPPGALSQEVSVRLTETSIPPPIEYEDWSPVYLIEPRGLLLGKVAAVRAPYGSNGSFASSKAIRVPAELALYQRDEPQTCAFAPIADSYGNAGFEQASVTSLGYLFVGVPKSSDKTACP